MGNCKDCKFWQNGQCEKVEWLFQGMRFPFAEDPQDLFAIKTYTDEREEYSNTEVEFHTGPMFGCVLFEQVETQVYLCGDRIKGE